MTGPEFALSVISSMIAAVLYDMLRNPSPPVFKDESKNLFKDTQKLIQKFASRILPTKKEENPRPTLEAFKKVIRNGHDHSNIASFSKNLLSLGQDLLKKDTHARPASFTASRPGTHALIKPDCVTFGGHLLFKKI
jgi:hypothetical protein